MELSTVPHYLCYDVEFEGSQNSQNRISDQFGSARIINLDFSRLTLCNPADKNNEGIENPDVPHLMCVDTLNVDPVAVLPSVYLRNQFGFYQQQVDREERLCVATRKTHEDCDCETDQRADIEVIKQVQADNSNTNNSNIVRYGVYVTNHGPDTAHDLVVEDALMMNAGTIVDVPEEQFSTTHGPGWSIDAQSSDSLMLTTSIDELSPGETAQLDFTVIVLTDLDEGVTDLTNTATAQGSVPDPVSDNNTDTLQIANVP